MNVYLIGAGGNSKVVREICQLNGYNIKGVFDDQTVPIIEIKNYDKINIINTIGNIDTRTRVFDMLVDHELNWINCVHPRAYISPSAEIGFGNIICVGAVINPDTIIGNFNIINTNVIVEHDCKIGQNNHLAPGSILCGSVTIGCNNFIGANSVVRNTVKILDHNIIGCGSTVIRNIGSDTKSYGNPAHHV